MLNQEYKEYIRIAREDGSIYIEVCDVYWEGPHTPVSEWRRLIKITAPMNISQLDSVIESVLKNDKYFGYCKTCSSHHVNGHMHSKSCCQSCAVNLGVVY
jgi:hypothetical protein